MPIITNDSISHIYEEINAAARSECRKWAMRDWEDIAQSVFEYVWKRDQNGDFDEVGETSPDFHRSVRRYTKQIVNAERVDYMYFKGAYLYSRPAIVSLLDQLAWGDTPEKLSLVEARVDVHRSYDRLSENYKLALFRRYALGIRPERKSAEEKTMHRAVDRFMDYLNFVSAVEQASIEDIANE